MHSYDGFGMHACIRRAAIGLLAWGLFAAGAAEQPRAAAPPDRNPVRASAADDADNLRDPFSPIGYRAPVSEVQGPASVSNMPPPSVDLKAKAEALLRVRGIIKRGNTYAANVNGTIVQVGDEVGVTVDGRTVVFVIRAISLERVQLEPKE